jgi:tRNA A37 threonylcarbamoyladenosine dehydratase
MRVSNDNLPTNAPPDPERRFGGVARLYGAAASARFASAHVCVIGLGGVGSWVVEALARSAVGELTLVDMDHVAESNVNRQLQAVEENFGKAKATALCERIATINPDCRVHEIDDFISPENQAEILGRERGGRYDWVVDCIDNFRTKAALIHHCRSNKIKLLTCGGAGGMIDPTCIKIADLSRSDRDPLLAKTRKLLRQSHGFPRNPKRRFDIPCVYSDEQLVYPDGSGGLTFEKPDGAAASGLNCAGGFGSGVCVTAPMGFAAASHVLKKLAEQAVS